MVLSQATAYFLGERRGRGARPGIDDLGERLEHRHGRRRHALEPGVDEERLRRFCLNVRYRPSLIAEWERQGYRFTREKRGFDIIIVGDTIRNAEEYGNALLCFLNHGTGIKNILYRNLARHPEHRYQVFVEGQYRVDRLRESGSLHRSEVHLVGLPKLDYVFAEIEKWTMTMTKMEVMNTLNSLNVPCGPILSMKEIAEEPSLRKTGTVVEVDHPKRGKYLTVGNPIKLSDSPSDVRPSPQLGEHTEEVLRTVVGLNDDEIQAARQQGAI